MTLKIQLFLLFVSSIMAVNIQHFYKALYSNSLTTIEAVLEELETEKVSSTQQAYKGALLMKKSGFMKTAGQKIEVFKEGHVLLEASIKKYPQNTEYRFIRLTIQEHAPKILKYNKNLEEDKALVIAGYRKMSSKIQAYILDYAGQSEFLTTKDLE